MVVEDFQGGTLYLSLEGLPAGIPHPSKDGDTGRIGWCLVFTESLCPTPKADQY